MTTPFWPCAWLLMQFTKPERWTSFILLDVPWSFYPVRTWIFQALLVPHKWRSKNCEDPTFQTSFRPCNSNTQLSVFDMSHHYLLSYTGSPSVSVLFSRSYCTTLRHSMVCFQRTWLSSSVLVFLDKLLGLLTNFCWSCPRKSVVAQLVEHRAVTREVMSSTPAGPTLRVLK